MRLLLLVLAGLLAGAEAGGRRQKAPPHRVDDDDDAEPNVFSAEDAPLTETMFSCTITPAASHGAPLPAARPASPTLRCLRHPRLRSCADGVLYDQDANAALVNSILSEIDVDFHVECVAPPQNIFPSPHPPLTHSFSHRVGRHADRTVVEWCYGHEVGDRNGHHHINGVVVVSSQGSDADKAKYVRNRLRICCTRVANVRRSPHALAHTSLPLRRFSAQRSLRLCAARAVPDPPAARVADRLVPPSLLCSGPDVPHRRQARQEARREGALAARQPRRPAALRCDLVLCFLDLCPACCVMVEIHQKTHGLTLSLLPSPHSPLASSAFCAQTPSLATPSQKVAYVPYFTPLHRDFAQYAKGYCYKDHTLPHFNMTYGGTTLEDIKQCYLIYLGKCSQNSFAGGKKATKNPLSDRKEINIMSGSVVPVTMAFVCEHGLEGLVQAGVLSLALVLCLMLISRCWRLDESLAVGRNGGNPVSSERLQALLSLSLITRATPLAVIYAAVTTVLSGCPVPPSATNAVTSGPIPLPSSAMIVDGNWDIDNVKALAVRHRLADDDLPLPPSTPAADPSPSPVPDLFGRTPFGYEPLASFNPVAPNTAFGMFGRNQAAAPEVGISPVAMGSLPAAKRRRTTADRPIRRALYNDFLAEFEDAVAPPNSTPLDLRYLVVDFLSSTQAATTEAMFIADGGIGSSCLRTDQLIDACGYVATGAALAADGAGPDLFSTLECIDVGEGNTAQFIKDANRRLGITPADEAVKLWGEQMLQLASELDGRTGPDTPWLHTPMPMATFRGFYRETLVNPLYHDTLQIVIVNTVEGVSASSSRLRTGAGDHWFLAAWLISSRDDTAAPAAAAASPMAAAAAEAEADADSDSDSDSDGIESEPPTPPDYVGMEASGMCPDLNTPGSHM